MTSQFPWLTLMIAAPLLTSLWIRSWEDHERARRVSLTVMGSLLLGSLALMLLPSTADGWRVAEVFTAGPFNYHLGVDGINAPMILLACLISLGLIAGSPKAAATSRSFAVLLTRAAALIGCFLSLDALWLLFFWIFALIPGQVSDRDEDATVSRRVYRVYLLGGTIPLAVAVGIIGWLGFQAGSAAPFDIVESISRGIPSTWQMPLFILLAVSLMMRMAIFPFHSWLPVFTERGPMTVNILIIGTHIGLYLVVRLVLPLLPEASAQAMPLIADIALLSAIYGAILALAQRDLRRIIGALTVSQRGLMLVGLASLNAQSVSGAILLFIGSGAAVAGLMLVIWSLESRIGNAHLPRFAGLIRQTPVMASLFFLFAVGCVGFPGSLSFVAEDLLIHGVIEAHPIVAGLMLLATCLNGITLIRAFFYTFLGDSETPYKHVQDIIPRERLVYLMLLALILLGGWFPQALISQWQPKVNTLSAAFDPQPSHTHPLPAAHAASLPWPSPPVPAPAALPVHTP
jgi:NADH-quinone oxidoreductase subunit M